MFHPHTYVFICKRCSFRLCISKSFIGLFVIDFSFKFPFSHRSLRKIKISLLHSLCRDNFSSRSVVFLRTLNATSTANPEEVAVGTDPNIH